MPGFLPDRLPDETLYSWAARFHCVSGNLLAADTTRMLFGDRVRGCAHDLPGGLDILVDRTEGVLGSAEELLQVATVLPQLLAFHSTLVCESAISHLRAGGQASLKYRLGMAQSIFGGEVHLKACPECMSEDINRYQVAYHSCIQIDTVSRDGQRPALGEHDHLAGNRRRQDHGRIRNRHAGRKGLRLSLH
ncbi:TniQ family protein [Chitinimonas naiadis]